MNEPVAWAYIKDDGFFDAIHPDEHDKYEGMYTTPVYTHPAKTLTPLTDEEIKDQFMWKCPRSGRLEIFTYAVRWAEERHKRNEVQAV